MQLRPYQEKAVAATWDYITSNPEKSGIVVIPPGGGKSLIIAKFCEEAIAKWSDTRIIQAVNVRELVSQNYSEFVNLCPFINTGIYSAGLNRKDERSQVTFVGIQSVYKKAYDLQGCHVLIIDECHAIPKKGLGMWLTFIKELRAINPHMVVIGFTATSFRLDSGNLTSGEGKLFDDIIYEYSILEAVNEGYLCPIIPTQMATRFDLSNVGTLGGDYKQNELEAAVNIDSITRKAIDEIEAYGVDRKTWLIFSSGNKHAEAIHLELKRRGYDGEVVTQKTDKKTRDRAISDLRSMRIRYIVNNKILTTGTNIPNIDLIADLGPTKSGALVVQKLGRGTRLFPEKNNCLLLDFARNVDYHGPLDKIRGKDKTKGEGGDAPMKVCPECHQVCFAGLRKCFACGYEFEGMGGPDIRSHGGDAAVLSTQIEPEWYTVNEMYLNRHAKEGKIPSMRVDYFDFAKGRVSEWICFEHTGFARQKAEKWHRVRLYDAPVPRNVDEAIELPYPKPAKILVRWEGKYARVIDYDFRVEDEVASQDIQAINKSDDYHKEDDDEYYEIKF